MKTKLLLGTVLAGAMVLNAQSKKVGVGAVDDFSTATEFGSANDGGIYWFKGDNDIYTLDRQVGKMVVNCVEATGFVPFGLGFGDDNGDLPGGNDFYLDLSQNADIRIKIKNNSADLDARVTIQLEDLNGNQAAYLPDESQVTNNWGGPRKQKISAFIPVGETSDVIIDLSSIPGKVGGLKADGFPCSSPLDCPITSYAIDPSRVSKILFFVNDDSSLPASDRVSPAVEPFTGSLEFTFFSIGKVNNDGGLTGTKDQLVRRYNNENVNVYNVQGMLIGTGKISEMNLNKGQMYIIKSETKTQKVVLN
ncbi:MAG: hypothetical protein SNJ77_02565 [Cytophagales bacterium]